MHVADCAQLEVLKAEADAFVAANPALYGYAVDHWYREYNKRKSIGCGGVNMITPYDAGLRPEGYVVSVGDAVAQEGAGRILLENSGKILLE